MWISWAWNSDFSFLSCANLRARGLSAILLFGSKVAQALRKLTDATTMTANRRPLFAILVFGFISLLFQRIVFAHGGGHGEVTAAPAVRSWWDWSWEPLALVNLSLLSLLYSFGLWRLWAKAGVGRGVSIERAVGFLTGILALALALLSPIDTLSDDLQSVHMVQHMLIMMVAAPLLVIGAPAVILSLGLPRSWRQKSHRFSLWLRTRTRKTYLWLHPISFWLLYALTLWIAHLPELYAAALRSVWIHELQHLSFLVAACLFWSVLFHPLGYLKQHVAVGLLYLFGTSLQTLLLGAFMALSPSVWYREYLGRTDQWNLGALEDQQIAGFIMWMPACMMYSLLAAVIFFFWLREPVPSTQSARRVR